MSLKFDMTNFNERKQAYADLVSNGADQTEIMNAYNDMMDALQNDMSTQLENTVDARMKDLDSQRRHDPKITNKEIKFFDELTTDTTNKNEIILPEETVDEIFEDLVSEHPFLSTIGLKTTGLRLKILQSNATGKAVWGSVFGEIKGQLDQAFTETDATQAKLTAFVALPKDASEYGAAWIKTYAVQQITEAFAVAMEEAFIVGSGKEQPIGLNRSVAKGVSVTDGVYPEKTADLSLTLADNETTKKEIAQIIKALSVKENGKAIVAKGKTVIVVRPGDDIDLEAASMIQNVNGQWVFALPFGVTVVSSEFVPEGKAIAFLPERYDAFVAGAINIKLYDQTLALEDMDLYTAKQFVYGKAKDDKAAVVINFSPSNA